MPFRPNMTGTVYRTNGFNYNGEPDNTLTEIGTFRFGIVRLTQDREKSAVRADSSASRGSMDETNSDARVMCNFDSSIEINDIVGIIDKKYRVSGTHPRYDVTGRPHHLVIDLETWNDVQS